MPEYRFSCVCFVQYLDVVLMALLSTFDPHVDKEVSFIVEFCVGVETLLFYI
jgi:hypothetical protein